MMMPMIENPMVIDYLWDDWVTAPDYEEEEEEEDAGTDRKQNGRGLVVGRD